MPEPRKLFVCYWFEKREGVTSRTGHGSVDVAVEVLLTIQVVREIERQLKSDDEYVQLIVVSFSWLEA